MFLICLVLLRFVGEFLEHDLTNDYLATCNNFDTGLSMSFLKIEQIYIIGRIVESFFHFLAALVVCPVLIYHLYKYHPE